jgi:hypothetical protein
MSDNCSTLSIKTYEHIFYSVLTPSNRRKTQAKAQKLPTTKALGFELQWKREKKERPDSPYP